MARPAHEPKHLLDTDAEQNIGNSANLQPQDGGGPAGGTVLAQSNPERLLMLSGPSKTAQTTSVALTASRLVGPANPNPGFAGPVTGVLEFGNGGRYTSVEVDVPVGPYLGFFQGAQGNTAPQDGGVVVTVPSGVLRVYARYDNRLLQPTVGFSISLAQALGLPVLGPGGPIYAPNPNPGPAEPVLVKAMAAYYTRHFSRAYKTHYLYVGATGVPAQVIPQNVLLIPLRYCVPAFARSVQILRHPVSAAMVVTMWDSIQNQPVDQVSVPANTSPVIPIVGSTNVVGIYSATNNDAVDFLALCYEIGI